MDRHELGGENGVVVGESKWDAEKNDSLSRGEVGNSMDDDEHCICRGGMMMD